MRGLRSWSPVLWGLASALGAQEVPEFGGSASPLFSRPDPPAQDEPDPEGEVELIVVTSTDVRPRFSWTAAPSFTDASDRNVAGVEFTGTREYRPGAKEAFSVRYARIDPDGTSDSLNEIRLRGRKATIKFDTQWQLEGLAQVTRRFTKHTEPGLIGRVSWSPAQTGGTTFSASAAYLWRDRDGQASTVSDAEIRLGLRRPLGSKFRLQAEYKAKNEIAGEDFSFVVAWRDKWFFTYGNGGVLSLATEVRLQ